MEEGTIAGFLAELIIQRVKRLISLLCRWLYLAIVLACVAYLATAYLHRSDWYKERLYRQLLAGTAGEQLKAASGLAQLNAQEQLLEALRSDQPSAREMAQRALEYVWFNSAGDEAYQLVEQAYKASEKADFKQALGLLNRVVEKYPKFAEGWNRRASVYWQMGEYGKSIADSRQTLILNPNHYGAWQGIGICRLKTGDVAEACRCLRAALKIAPYDEGTRNSLERCEGLLRRSPQPAGKSQPMELI